MDSEHVDPELEPTTPGPHNYTAEQWRTRVRLRQAISLSLGVPVEDVSVSSSEPLFAVHTDSLHTFATIYMHAIMLYGSDAVSYHDGADDYDYDPGYYIYISPDRIKRSV